MVIKKIPKVIHYCWFGGNAKPDLVLRCIDSWKKFCPDFEIREWNENNFNVFGHPFTKQAYIERKYSFVSDFARLWIIYNYGGLYFDTDAELIQGVENLLSDGGFIGTEKCGTLINPGSGFGAVAGHEIIKLFLGVYEKLSFENEDGVLKMTPIVALLTPILEGLGWKKDNSLQKINDFVVYPVEYFCPIDYDKEMKITPRTLSIHHFAGSWIDDDMVRISRIETKLSKLFGIKLALGMGYAIKIYKRKGLVFFIKRIPSLLKKFINL